MTTSEPAAPAWTRNKKLTFILTAALVLIGFWLQSREPQQRTVGDKKAPPVATNSESSQPATDAVAEQTSRAETTSISPTTPIAQDPEPQQTTRSLPPPAKSETPATSTAKKTPAKDPTKIPNVTVRDQDGDVIFQGTVDLAETLARIDAGRTLSRFPHDGTVFQNREDKLPLKPPGYYREFVHPTPNTSGPGPQRIVMGEEGETYYTHDHYRSFKKVR